MKKQKKIVLLNGQEEVVCFVNFERLFFPSSRVAHDVYSVVTDDAAYDLWHPREFDSPRDSLPEHELPSVLVLKRNGICEFPELPKVGGIPVRWLFKRRPHSAAEETRLQHCIREMTAPKTKTATKIAPATATASLEAEIIRILSRDFPNIKARPTATEFYQEHIINGCSMAGLARAKGWSTRTMKARKANIETHLTQKLGMPVDLDELKAAPRKSGKIVYTDPRVIERTYGDDPQRNKD